MTARIPETLSAWFAERINLAVVGNAMTTMMMMRMKTKTPTPKQTTMSPQSSENPTNNRPIRTPAARPFRPRSPASPAPR
jgi:hypothetical protein